MLRRAATILLLSCALPAAALAQSTTTNTGDLTRPAVVTVPSTGRNYPSNDGTTAQAPGMVLLNPTTGTPYAISGSTSGNPSYTTAAPQSYTLLNGATSTGSQAPNPGSYALNLPATFGTIVVTATSSNGTVQTTTYTTSAPSTPPVVNIFSGTTISATATGTTPSGNTTLALGPPTSGNQFGVQTIQGRGPATATQTSVAVPVNTSTQLIAANASRRGLQIIPANQNCSINDSGGTASATSKPIPSGWNYTELDPPPASAVTAFCTVGTTISITELN